MIGLLLRLAGRFGFRWFLVGAVARFVARRLGQATVERAGRELEAKARERLPDPVARVVPPLPTEAVQAGGSAVVAGRAVKGAVSGTRRAGRAMAGGRRRLAAMLDATTRPLDTTVELARRARDEVRAQLEATARELTARRRDAALGPDEATDALLDVRPAPSPIVRPTVDELHEAVPEPVRRGRRRPRRPRRRLVARAARNYRPPTKAWE